MVIIVTGAIGIGKTMVCQKVIEMARRRGCNCGGILTYKAPDGITIQDIQTGQRETLASLNNVYQGPQTVKYSFNPRGIDFGIEAINRGVSSDILLIDEIGQLELGGEGFVNATELVRTNKSENIILVIRKELLSAFLPRLGTTALVFETTVNNRDGLPREIDSVLAGKSGENAEAL